MAPPPPTPPARLASAVALVLGLALAGAFMLGAGTVLAQAPAPEPGNLVPNPGFETFRVRPLGWYYKGSNYNRVMRYWDSPTTASPDAYNAEVRVPAAWADKGFGQRAAHGGEAMSGVTVYGCADGKPHCREYLQVQLLAPLVAGQRYRLSVWVAALPRGLRCDGLGAAFAKTPTRHEDARRLALEPLARFGGVADPGDDWRELSAEFTAGGGELYLVFGNFHDDAATGTVAPAVSDPLNFAYYYVDDVELVPLPPLLQAPAPNLSARALVPGAAVTLRNVYFDTDSDELQPRSFRELDRLAALLRAAPDTRVRIVGHTDDAGDAAYNEDLSRRRAARVVQYLEDGGVAADRLASEGRGPRQPVADNDTPAGRALNRRVVAEVE